MWIANPSFHTHTSIGNGGGNGERGKRKKQLHPYIEGEGETEGECRAQPQLIVTYYATFSSPHPDCHLKNCRNSKVYLCSYSARISMLQAYYGTRTLFSVQWHVVQLVEYFKILTGGLVTRLTFLLEEYCIIAGLFTRFKKKLTNVSKKVSTTYPNDYISTEASSFAIIALSFLGNHSVLLHNSLSSRTIGRIML